MADRIAAAGWLANAMCGSGIRLGRGALESGRDADECSRRDSDAALLRGLHGEPGANEDSRSAPHQQIEQAPTVAVPAREVQPVPPKTPAFRDRRFVVI